MCDYSLHGLPNRLAIDGEQLLTHRFPTLSIGLASPRDIMAASSVQHDGNSRRSWWSVLKRCLLSPREKAPVPAVCIPPGARLRMYSSPRHSLRYLGVRPIEEVTFVQTTAIPFHYRDGIELGNGLKILLQMLPEGVRFDVLSTDTDKSEWGPVVSEVERILADFDREAIPYRSPA
jgi:hypothetical protein